MRWITVCLGAWLFATAGVRAQVTGLEISVSLEDTVFLPGEEVPVAVRITNLAGRPLSFGEGPDWLVFHVETRGGNAVERLAPTPYREPFMLESSQAGTQWWNIQPLFDLDEGGSYVVYAELRMPEWERRVFSRGATFIVQPARKMWEVTFGVPPEPGVESGAPEVRRYALQSVTRLKERRLYARVTNVEETHIYRVVFLDRLLTFSNPEQQLDILSRLHVLFQTGGNTYTYCVVDPDGELVIRQRHEILPGSRPFLARTDGGRVEVRGGRRLPALTDIPLPEPPPITVGLATPPPAAVTNVIGAPEPRETRAERRRREREERRQSP
ncbi:MAG: hypothetical protein KF833_23185 [Verrucomicrobiae bacterium]|nr:hypothetical protein [Verrucomicrobiae bacterium]